MSSRTRARCVGVRSRVGTASKTSTSSSLSVSSSSVLPQERLFEEVPRGRVVVRHRLLHQDHTTREGRFHCEVPRSAVTPLRPRRPQTEVPAASPEAGASVPVGRSNVSCPASSLGSSTTGLGRCALWWRAVASSMATAVRTWRCHARSQRPRRLAAAPARSPWLSMAPR